MDVLGRMPLRADHRLKYGVGDLHFGDLWLPAVGAGKKAPVVVFIHGGWWKAAYDLAYGGFFCEALKRDCIAVWSLEYRRVGDAGGGWPGTFEDVAAGYDFLATLAKNYSLDMERVVVAGHSAGGHLAYWLAGRPHLPDGPLAHLRTMRPMRGVIGLAGAVDLRLTIDLAGWFTFAHDKVEVGNFMGGLPAAVPERYRAGNPGDLLPLKVPQFLIQGDKDDEIPPQLPLRWAERGRRTGEKVSVDIVAGANHLDVVDPESKAWGRVRAMVGMALGV